MALRRDVIGPNLEGSRILEILLSTYPLLPDGLDTKLRAVELACASDGSDVEEYLKGSNCPYSESLKGFLRKMLSREKVAKNDVSSGEAENPFRAPGMDDVDRFDLLLIEVEATIGQMRQLERDLGNGEETDRSDMVAVLKAKTSLLEKWVGLKDRALNLREMAEFQRIVLRVLDEVLTVDQRSDVVGRLRDLRSVDAEKALGVVES